MQLGLVGLGRMGGNMRERIRGAGHEVVGYDRNQDIADVANLTELVEKLQTPRVVWTMVPAGKITESTIDELADLLSEGDLIIDGGNSKFTDDKPRAERLAAKGVGEHDASSRIASQLEPEKRLAKADIVIDNSGSLEELARQVDEVWEELQRRLQRRTGSTASGRHS